MTVHAMLDLETWGTKPGAALASIGACVFDPNGDPTEKTAPGRIFYRLISLESCLEAGLKMEADTVRFWMEQPDETRLELFKNPEPLKRVLEEFWDWLKSCSAVYVWSHGATFDPVLLQAAYFATSSYSLPAPWDFRSVRDTRTLFAMADALVEQRKRISAGESTYVWKPERPFAKHNALSDAVHQARCVQAALKFLGQRL